MYPGRGSIPRQTDWLTVSRNVTQTQTQTQERDSQWVAVSEWEWDPAELVSELVGELVS
jgi:hypothetical protein